MPKLLIDSPSVFKLGRFSKDNVIKQKPCGNKETRSIFRSAICQFGFEIDSRHRVNVVMLSLLRVY